uniref:Uncharacterized protein n=1 Tax=Bactrocera latifrons TaxID=174628 RepID=A0A0K8U0Q7_BACLA
MSLQVQQRSRCWRSLIHYKNLCVITNDEASANVLAVDAQVEAVGQPVRCWRLFALNYFVLLFVLIKHIDEEADCRRVGTIVVYSLRLLKPHTTAERQAFQVTFPRR